MKRATSVLVFYVLCYVFLSTVTKSFSDLDFEFKNESGRKYEEDRMDEVKKHCASVLSSASELIPEDKSRIFRIRRELGFRMGDWVQENGNSPILPFDDRIVQKNPSQDPLNIASFWVTKTDRSHRSKKYIGVNGVLMMAKTAVNGLPNGPPFEKTHKFEMWPGHSQLWISFQGIYTVSKQDNEERVLCLLGETVLPSRESDSSGAAAADPWKWVKDFSYGTPPLLQDDQIRLIIRYPRTYSLMNRVVRGELTSLNQKSNLKYFDQIHILSQLGKPAHYEFSNQEIVDKACSPYPYRQDSFLNSGINVYNGTSFCEILERVGNGGAFTILPNWKCNGTNEYCGKLGPFMSDKEIGATNGSFKDVKLYMQDVICEQTLAKRKTPLGAQVSAVFRAVDPSEDDYISASRSAPTNMTVSAEGIWKASSGQLCMIGCVGAVDSKGSSCNTVVSLYIPVTFSIRQRSSVVGSFSSIDDKKNVPSSYFPLSFEKLIHPMDSWSFLSDSRPRYSYSKIDMAGAILEKDEPFSFGTIIKKSLLRFPKLEDSADYLSSLSLLSEDLTLHIPAVPDPLPRSHVARVDFGLDILSLGPLFGRYWSSGNFSIAEKETPYHTKAEYSEKQLLLNVSAQISLSGNDYGNFSALFLEGLYDEHVGKMYLVGCRDVRASWKILFDSNDLEAGLDCLIEVVVSYPSTTSRWVINPSARVSITSQRPEDDPLYFKPIKLKTFPVVYRRQRQDIISQMGVEGILRILTLSFAISCITAQLFYIRQNPGFVPFMSLVMLGVQALGYSLPLITEAEALFRRKNSKPYEMESFDLQKEQRIYVIDYAVKLLVLVSFLLTLRLCQIVWKSRRRLITQTPDEPKRVPSDRRVFLITLIIHAIGLVTVLVVHSTNSSRRKLQVLEAESVGPPAVADSYNVSNGWETEVEEYIGLVQDFFLLPQVIANLLWQIDSRPLRKLYYIGITVVRLLPHVYDYVRNPASVFYFEDEHEFINPNFDFYSKFGDITIPMTAVVLAAVVFVQQRWDYERLTRILTFGRFKLLPERRLKYERVSSEPTETELVSGEDHLHRNSLRQKEEGYDD